MKFGTDVHGIQRMNPKDFRDPFTFHVAPPTSQNYHIRTKTNDQIQVRKVESLTW